MTTIKIIYVNLKPLLLVLVPENWDEEESETLISLSTICRVPLVSEYDISTVRGVFENPGVAVFEFGAPPFILEIL